MPKPVDPHFLHKIFICDAEAGTLIWKTRSADTFYAGPLRSAEAMALAFNKQFSGKDAGTLRTSGRKTVNISGHGIYMVYQIIWAMTYMRWPDSELDHKNRNPSDNRISNLREVTRGENEMNKGLTTNNTSGIRGVSWSTQKNRWHVRIYVKGKCKSVGFFTTLAAAAGARRKAELQYYPHIFGGENVHASA